MTTQDEINKRKLAITKAIKAHYVSSEDDGAWIISAIDEIEDLARADSVEATYVTCNFCDASDVKGYHIKALDKAELYICENCFDIPSAVKTKMEEEFRADERANIDSPARFTKLVLEERNPIPNLTKFIKEAERQRCIEELKELESELKEEDKMLGGWAVRGEWVGANKAIAKLSNQSSNPNAPNKEESSEADCMTTPEEKNKLKAEAWKEYDNAIEPALEEYMKVARPAREKYNKIEDSAMNRCLKRLKEIEAMK